MGLNKEELEVLVSKYKVIADRFRRMKSENEFCLGALQTYEDVVHDLESLMEKQ